MKQPDIDRIVGIIVENYKPDKIVLFGSYAYGKPDRDSDLDLLIVKNKTKKKEIDMYKLRKRLPPDIPMDIFFTTKKEIENWKSVPMSFYTYILKNGKVLYERKH